LANRSKKIIVGGSALNETGSGDVDVMGAPTVTMYVKFAAGTSAGAVKLQGSPVGGGAGGVDASDVNWADIGAPVAWAAASSTRYLFTAEGHRFVRAKISTAIAGGSVDVTLVTSGFAGGNFQE